MPSSKPCRPRFGNEKGAALYLVAALMFLFMALIGMAVDIGRGYIVRNALGTAVDGAALAAARTIPQGTDAAIAAANKIFNANFPAGFLGVTSVTNPPQLDFQIAADGSNLITVSSQAVVPTTFMRLVPGGSHNNLNVVSSGQATRRLVDMSFVIDRSGSLGGDFPAVRTASSNFIAKFDDAHDRIALISFSNNVVVHSPIVTPGRGFSTSTLQTQIGALSAGGNTGTAEGLYQAWNQLRMVPRGFQSGLRVVVLFTDGAPNSFQAQFPTVYPTCTTANPNVPSGTPVTRVGTLLCGDPVVGTPTFVQGLWDTYNASDSARVSPANVANSYRSQSSNNFTVLDPCIPSIPAVSQHTPQLADGGLPRSFLLYDPGLPAQLPLINPSAGTFPNHVQNANNAARNLAQIIANGIRADTTGDAPIHIFALGLGNLLTVPTGADRETGASMLRRLSNDPSSPDFNPAQPEGGYFFAGNTGELAAAFEAIRDRIIRISH